METPGPRWVVPEDPLTTVSFSTL
ncbi:MAG: hypothetical protein JWL99_6483, partial [Streptomyces oryziradicis]|nr:hypothetical protein [Actinacidiphila oryziradicis]